jgi:hypothetical protein
MRRECEDYIQADEYSSSSILVKNPTPNLLKIDRAEAKR